MSSGGDCVEQKDDSTKAKPVRNYEYSSLDFEGPAKRRRVPSEIGILPETLSTSEKEALDKWKGILSQTKHFYEAVFVLGPMCSGKTSEIFNFRGLDDYKRFAYVDTDEIMKGLEGYDGTSVDLFYPSARNVSIHLTDWLLDECMSFIAEGTCVKYDELRDYMLRLKDKGYNIRVKKIDGVSLEVLLDRAKKRVSRQVSLEVIKDIYVNSNIGLNMLWTYNKDGQLFNEFV